jgi:hypothetical protein
MVETCGGCKFFKRMTPLQPGGWCRARSPIPVFTGPIQRRNALGEVEIIPNVGSFFPQTSDVEWCGEWQARPAENRMAAIDLGKLDVGELEGSA